MTETETILQCGMCHRQHDGGGGLLAFRFCVPAFQSCGRDDCARIVAEDLQLAADRRARKAQRRAECDAVKQAKPERRARSAAPYQAPQHSESQLPPSDRFDAPESGLQGKAVSALDFETSANARLLEFFQLSENFNVWFAAKFLEDEIGRTSGRMNNRAIWLRAKFNPMGLELDQNAQPKPELPLGSYYRICRIEDAKRLTAAEKVALIAAQVQGRDAEVRHSAGKTESVQKQKEL